MKKNKLHQWENNKPHEIDFLYNFLRSFLLGGRGGGWGTVHPVAKNLLIPPTAKSLSVKSPPPHQRFTFPPQNDEFHVITPYKLHF